VRIAGNSQVFRGNTVVEPGEQIDQDVMVFDGNVTVRPEGRINGNLVVYTGNIAIEQGGRIDGDVTTFSGNVDIAGAVDGDIVTWSGNIWLRNSARIGGDISAFSGNINREPGAEVGGNIVRPFGAQRAPAQDGLAPPAPPQAVPGFGPAVVVQRPTVIDRLLGFFVRLLGAGLLTLFAMLLTGALVSVAPEMITRTENTVRRQGALSFITGLLTNLVLLALVALLTITLCLLPVALIPMAALFALAVIGWTVAASVLGKRLETWIDRPLQPVVSTILGTAVLTAVIALIWAVSGFRSVAFLGWLAVSSAGIGGFLLPWIQRNTGSWGGSATTGAAVYPVPPAGSRNDSATVDADVRGATAVEPDSGAETAGIREEAPPIGSERVAPPTAEPDVTIPEPQATNDVVESGVVGGTTEDSASAAAETEEELVKDSVPTSPVMAGLSDDFTQLRGVGPVSDRRLKDAGVNTFAQLASLAAEEAAEIMRLPVDRVVNNDIVGQARARAGMS
jgi:predicted flap endonuclease-1-like 5' DNA nuclease/cytoskeletal protein CcmA (bactofilin family)